MVEKQTRAFKVQEFISNCRTLFVAVAFLPQQKLVHGNSSFQKLQVLRLRFVDKLLFFFAYWSEKIIFNCYYTFPDHFFPQSGYCSVDYNRWPEDAVIRNRFRVVVFFERIGTVAVTDQEFVECRNQKGFGLSLLLNGGSWQKVMLTFIGFDCFKAALDQVERFTRITYCQPRPPNKILQCCRSVAGKISFSQPMQCFFLAQISGCWGTLVE